MPRCTYLVFFEAVLKDVLNNQATCLTKCYFMPHTTKSFIDILHDLWWRLSPAKFEKLLPDMTSVTMNDSLRDTTKEFVNHDGLIVLWDRVKSLLNDVAAKCVHG